MQIKDHDIVAQKRKSVIVVSTDIHATLENVGYNNAGSNHWDVTRKRKAVIVPKAIKNASLLKFGSVAFVFQV